MSNECETRVSGSWLPNEYAALEYRLSNKCVALEYRLSNEYVALEYRLSNEYVALEYREVCSLMSVWHLNIEKLIV